MMTFCYEWANTLRYKVSKNNDSMGMYLHLGFGLFIWLQIHVLHCY